MMVQSTKSNGLHDEESNTLEWREDMIEKEFGHGYDQQGGRGFYGRNKAVTEAGNGSLHSEGQPYRYLDNWYIVQTQRSKSSGYAAYPYKNVQRRRYPLPTGNKFSPTQQLHGILEPNENTFHKPIHIVIHKLNIWILDCTSNNNSRGFWVESASAWYRLKNPCSIGIPISVSFKDDSSESISVEATLPSQADLHLPYRARFGLLSNIVDILSEEYAGEPYYYLSLHANRTPLDSYEILKTNENSDQTGTVPFDLELLRDSADFIRHYLKDFHPLLDRNCEFIKGLERFENESIISCNESKWTTETYAKSAKEAEKRGNRTSFGDLINSNQIRPNHKLEIDISKASQLNESNCIDSEDSMPSSSQKHEISDNESNEIKSITVTNASSAFSPELHSNAKKALSEYMASDKGIDQNKIQEFITNVLVSSRVPSYEHILLCIKELRVSSKKVLKALFKKTAEGGRFVFIHWFNSAFLAMVKRRNINKATIDATEEMVIGEIMHLICDFSVIKEAKQLEVLKSKFGVDWQGLVRKTLDFERRKNIPHLLSAAERAAQHLALITGESLQSTQEKDETPDEIKERLRRQRMNKMKEKAQGVSKLDIADNDSETKPTRERRHSDKTNSLENSSRRQYERSSSNHRKENEYVENSASKDYSSSQYRKRGRSPPQRQSSVSSSITSNFDAGKSSSQRPQNSLRQEHGARSDFYEKSFPYKEDGRGNGYSSFAQRGESKSFETNNTSWNNNDNRYSEDISKRNGANSYSQGRKNVDDRHSDRNRDPHSRFDSNRAESSSSWSDDRRRQEETMRSRSSRQPYSGRRGYEEDGEIDEERAMKRRRESNDYRGGSSSRYDQSTFQSSKYNGDGYRDGRNVRNADPYEKDRDYNQRKNHDSPVTQRDYDTYRRSRSPPHSPPDSYSRKERFQRQLRDDSTSESRRYDDKRSYHNTDPVKNRDRSSDRSYKTNKGDDRYDEKDRKWRESRDYSSRNESGKTNNYVKTSRGWGKTDIDRDYEIREKDNKVDRTTRGWGKTDIDRDYENREKDNKVDRTTRGWGQIEKDRDHENREKSSKKDQSLRGWGRSESDWDQGNREEDVKRDRERETWNSRDSYRAYDSNKNNWSRPDNENKNQHSPYRGNGNISNISQKDREHDKRNDRDSYQPHDSNKNSSSRTVHDNKNQHSEYGGKSSDFDLSKSKRNEFSDFSKTETPIKSVSPQPPVPLGRGRGRDRNLPAWMTSGQMSHDQVKKAVEENNRSKVNSVDPPTSTTTNLQSGTRDLTPPNLAPSRGRGRGKNLPAWMTSGQVSQDVIRKAVEVAEESRRNAPPPQLKNFPPPPPEHMQGKKGKRKKKNQSEKNNRTTESVSQAPLLRGAGRGHGLGRGRDVNLPAWMTAKKN